MFRDIFVSIFGVSYETRILEACNWDEDRKDHICDILCDELQQASRDYKKYENKNNDDLIDDLRESLLESMEDYEADVLLSVVTDCIENKEFLLYEIQELEN